MPRPAATPLAYECPCTCCTPGRWQPGWRGWSRRHALVGRRGPPRSPRGRSSCRSSCRGAGRHRAAAGGCVAAPGRMPTDPSEGAGWKLREFAWRSRIAPPRSFTYPNPGKSPRFRSEKKKGAPERPLAALVPGRVAVVAVRLVGLARAGLGEAAADHVADGDDGDVEPRLPGNELVGPGGGVAALDHRRGDEDADDDGDHRPELGGFERLFRLRGEAADHAAPRGAVCARGSGSSRC